MRGEVYSMKYEVRSMYYTIHHLQFLNFWCSLVPKAYYKFFVGKSRNACGAKEA